MKILIAVPTFESIYPDTFESIYALDRGGHDLRFAFVRGYDVASARNRIARKALDSDVDYVLMVDSDVVLPQDALVNLLEGGKDAVLGYYAHRGKDNRYSGRVCVCKTGYDHYPEESEYTASELRSLSKQGITKLEIHGGGMGCALIRTDVFRRLRYPWYDWVNYADDHRGMLSEDLYFCEQCKNNQIRIYTDTRVGCGHMLRRVQWPE